jgi:predicted component of type VI protein secretion system
MSGPSLIVGRAHDADIAIADQSVSTRHAELSLTKDGRLFVTDCGSRNGTFVQDGGRTEPLRQGAVSSSATVYFGSCAFPVAQLLELVRAAAPARAPVVAAAAGWVRCDSCAAPRRRGVACHVCGGRPGAEG